MSNVGFAGDWHGNTKWAVQAIEYAKQKGIATLLHVGDYGFKFTADWVNAIEFACSRYDVNIYAVRGNHDDPGFISSLSLDEDGLHVLSNHVRFIPDGHSVSLDGLVILGLGGAPSIDCSLRVPGVTWWENETLDPTVLWSLAKADVVISHDCPNGVDLNLDPKFSEYFESIDPGIVNKCDNHRKLVAAAVNKVSPRLVVHGHYHNVTSDRMTILDGSETKVVGLDCDGTEFDRNIKTIDEIWAL